MLRGEGGGAQASGEGPAVWVLRVTGGESETVRDGVREGCDGAGGGPASGGAPLVHERIVAWVALEIRVSGVRVVGGRDGRRGRRVRRARRGARDGLKVPRRAGFQMAEWGNERAGALRGGGASSAASRGGRVGIRRGAVVRRP